MIKNERQYRITKAQTEKFAQALDRLRENTEQAGRPSKLRKAEQDAVRSQLGDLKAQLQEYESLRSGRSAAIEARSFEELPTALIRARIASGMSQRELAERLGMKEQQVQRYEATEFAGASLRRIGEVMKALRVTAPQILLLGSRDLSGHTLMTRLGSAGLDRDFVRTRLILGASQSGGLDSLDESAVARVASIIGRIFGWSPETILNGDPLELNSEVARAARFKVGARASQGRLSSYAVYAHYLALLLIQATDNLPRHDVPEDPYQIHNNIVSEYGTLSLSSVLRYTWSLGIPILPLDDPGAFQGACFREDLRDVIVVNQNTSSPADWLHTIIHELYHTTQERENPIRTVLEDSETSPERRESEEELLASRFATAVLLGPEEKRYAEMCVEQSRGNLGWLKSAVQRVASTEGVPVDILAKYMAFRLWSEQGENWWSTAAALQRTDENPWLVARNTLFDFVGFDRLAEPDIEIMQRALTSREVIADA